MAPVPEYTPVIRPAIPLIGKPSFIHRTLTLVVINALTYTHTMTIG